MTFLLLAFSCIIDYRFLGRMLKPKYKPAITYGGLAAASALASFVNVKCGLYLAFPQEIFFLLVSAAAIFCLYDGGKGKKVMLAIFMDGLGYTSCFLFLPAIHYAAGFVSRDTLLFQQLYCLCDVLNLLFCGAVYEWISRKYLNLQGDISLEADLYLLLLSFFIRQSVIRYGNSLMELKDYGAASALSITLAAAVGVALLLFSLYYVDRRIVLALTGQQNDFLLKQIAAWKETEKELSGFRHDFKNHMLCLKSLLHSGRTEESLTYLEAITDTVNSFSSKISTGNPFADAVFMEKAAAAKARGILLETDLILPPADFLSPLDLCIILSNALDNAIEACQRLPKESGLKKIRAVSYVRHSCLMIEIENPLPPGTPSQEPFQSSKAEKRLHGIGLSNIHQAVDRLHGSLKLTAENGSFHFCAMVPLGHSLK